MQDCESTLTSTQIDNNVCRTSIQALSAVLGGTQSLHTNSKDEALALPTNESARLALRTQQIIAHESGINQYPDPFGGSYVVEEMTDNLINDAMKIISEIDDLGGTCPLYTCPSPRDRTRPRMPSSA